MTKLEIKRKLKEMKKTNQTVKDFNNEILNSFNHCEINFRQFRKLCKRYYKIVYRKDELW